MIALAKFLVLLFVILFLCSANAFAQIPTALDGYLELDFALAKEFNMHVDSVGRSFEPLVLPIFQNNTVIGYFSIDLSYLQQLPEGESVFKLGSNNAEVGEFRLNYASRNITFKSLQITKASINKSRINLINENLDASTSFNLISNSYVFGSLLAYLTLNKLADFDDVFVLSAELQGTNSQYSNEKVGDIKINAANINFQTISLAKNTFIGKINAITGEPITLGNVCVSAGQSPEMCLRIRKFADGSGNYGPITITDKNNTNITFKVNGVDSGTKQLSYLTPDVRFNLQVDTSNFNFADSDKDGIPNGMDNCQDSVVPDVDTRGCDCSQKQCFAGTKCQIDFAEGNKCVQAPITRCSKNLECLKKTTATQVYNSVAGTQSPGAPTNYVIDGKDYEVKVTQITSTGVNAASFQINGELTGMLIVGQELIIQDAAKLTIIKITNSTNQTNQTTDVVSFSITSLAQQPQSQNDAPKFCNQQGIVVNNCAQCGCPTDFTCSQSGDCIKVLTGLVGSICKDNDFRYNLNRVNCPYGWVKEDLLRYLSVDVDGPPLIGDYVEDKVQDKLKDVTLCLKTSDLGCAPANKPYTCRFEDLLEQNRGKAAQIIEENINSQLPPASFYEELSTGVRVGLGFASGGLLEILNLAGFLDIEITPHVDLTGFSLRNSYDCTPKLVTSDVECLPLINNGPSDKRVDLVFVGDGFLDDQVFVNTIKEMIDYGGQFENTDKEGLFSLEPYMSSKTKFNIWAVNAKDKINHVPSAKQSKGGIFPDERDVNEFASYCQNKDYTIVVSTAAYRSFCFYGGKAPCYVSIGGESYLGRLLSHEFGHGFASLGDEYAQQAVELKDAPDKIEDLITEVQTKFANCKSGDAEAQQSWGNLVTSDNKLGFFKSCGGDCMPQCENAVRPSYLSVMNSHKLNVESVLSSSGPQGIIAGTIKMGAPFHPYYLINYGEIQKKLEEYEAGDSKDTKFYETIEEEISTQQQTVTPTCIDSDNGASYYAKGIARRTEQNILGPLVQEDFCVGNILQESTCPGATGNVFLSPYTCQNGCLDGACIALPAEPLMGVNTDKPSYDSNEKIQVFSHLPYNMDAVYYFVSSTERKFIGSGSCPANGACFSYTALPAGNWQAEIIAWQTNTPNTAYKISSLQFSVV